MRLVTELIDALKQFLAAQRKALEEGEKLLSMLEHPDDPRHKASPLFQTRNPRY